MQVLYETLHQGKQVERNVTEKHGEVDDKRMEIVLIKLRTFAWPAVFVDRDDDVINVRIISDDSEKMVKESDIQMFDVEKITNTKIAKLKNVYTKAVKLLKNLLFILRDFSFK